MSRLLIALLLAGCLPDEPIGQEPVETVTITLTGDAFVDFASGELVEESAGWDLRLAGWNLFLNGGESGPGKAGGIDMELLDLDLQFEDMNRRNQVIWFFFFDSYACALSDWWWYALDGTHTLFSNFHPYVVRRGGVDYMVQILDYYDVVEGAAEAGFPEFRWAEVPDDPATAPDLQTQQINAQAGGLGADADDPANRWSYFSFTDGVLDLSDAEALASDAWDLGFKRFNIKSNSGPSGPAGVVTADTDPERGEQPDEVLEFTPGNQAGYFGDAIEAWAQGGDADFREDDVLPVVRRWHHGRPGSDTPPTLWEGRWFLVTDRSGEPLLKLRVVDFEGEDPAGPESLRIEFGFIPS